MVDMTAERPIVPKRRLLYDKDFLSDVQADVGNAIEMKAEIDTTATVYEIRTACEYWFGGQASHRTSDRVWGNCKAVDDGMWELNEDHELVYA